VEYQFNLTFQEAYRLMEAGAWVRRWDWTNRWWFRTLAFTWVFPDGESARVLLATDLTPVDLLASDWTTMWPDQQPCIVPPPPDPDPDPEDPPPEPPPPPPDPEPNPGGSTKRNYKFFSPVNQSDPAYIYGLRTVTNPFALPASVHVTGKADGPLVINGIVVISPSDAYSPAIVDHTFTLGSSEAFSFGTRRSGNGDSGYNLDFVFTA